MSLVDALGIAICALAVGLLARSWVVEERAGRAPGGVGPCAPWVAPATPSRVHEDDKGALENWFEATLVAVLWIAAMGGFWAGGPPIETVWVPANADDGGVARVVRDFDRALSTGDASAACELLTPDLQQRLAARAADGSCADAIRAPVASSSLVVTDVSVDGDHATVDLVRRWLGLPDGGVLESPEGALHLVRRGGGWRVDGGETTARALAARGRG